MECFHCKGKLVRGSAQISADRDGYPDSREAVPAWVSTQRGEVLFEENGVNQIQKALLLLDGEKG